MFRFARAWGITIPCPCPKHKVYFCLVRCSAWLIFCSMYYQDVFVAREDTFQANLAVFFLFLVFCFTLLWTELIQTLFSHSRSSFPPTLCPPLDLVHTHPDGNTSSIVSSRNLIILISLAFFSKNKYQVGRIPQEIFRGGVWNVLSWPCVKRQTMVFKG